MKTIGMIGGMSWESSSEYYRLVNRKIQHELGGYHSCQCIIYSVELAEIELLLREENWKELDRQMSVIAQKLEQAGADIIILCTNTIHNCSKAITDSISIPFLHIAEATGMEIIKRQISKVGLLGTKPTMEKDFYKKVLKDKFDISVVTPEKDTGEKIHRIIFDELVQGKFLKESRELIKFAINDLTAQGAEGIILGCTELPLIISESDVVIPLFNTTKLHAEKAVEWVLVH